MERVDPVTLEIVNNRLRFISKEMVITLTRTAYSSVIYDGHDCSAGLFDSSGQLLTLDAGIPFHISAMPFSVRAVIEEFKEDIDPGDIFITNDPAYGGTHLPDMLVILPIFYDNKLTFFAAARGHWTDVGGSTPGSLSGKATELIQEGLVIPPVKLFKKGTLDRRLAELLFSNMRMKEIRFGDMMSQIAACRHAEKSCQALISKYGPETLEKCTHEIIDRTEKSLRRKIETLPQGTFYYEDYLDNDGITKDARRIKVAVSVRNGCLHVDFTGTAEQSQGPINASLSTTHGAVVIAVKIVLDPSGIPNEGLFRLIKIEVPSGTLLNPRRGTPTGGFTEVGYRVVYCLIGALAKALPESVSGCDYGTVNHTYVSGVDDRTGKPFIHYEYPPGGNGGTFCMDGPNAMRGPISGNTSMQSNELVEYLNPLRTTYATLRDDSGGPGRFRGGLGLVRKVEILAKEAYLSVVTDRSAIPPFGVYKGRAGLGQKWSIVRNGVEKPIPYGGKTQRMKLKKGDILCCYTAGGGGYGDPIERDPEKVRRDVEEGYISLRSAAETYGVILKKDLSVDLQATERKRKKLKEKIRSFSVIPFSPPLFTKGMRSVLINPGDGRSFRSADLVELHYEECPVPYRVRLVFKRSVSPGHVLVDEELWQMMRLRNGSFVQIMRLSA